MKKWQRQSPSNVPANRTLRCEETNLATANLSLFTHSGALRFVTFCQFKSDRESGTVFVDALLCDAFWWSNVGKLFPNLFSIAIRIVLSQCICANNCLRWHCRFLILHDRRMKSRLLSNEWMNAWYHRFDKATDDRIELPQCVALNWHWCQHIIVRVWLHEWGTEPETWNPNPNRNSKMNNFVQIRWMK